MNDYLKSNDEISVTKIKNINSTSKQIQVKKNPKMQISHSRKLIKIKN